MNYLSKLDANQRRAVLHAHQSDRKRRSRPLIVIAGPGAGKTRVLISCAVHSVSEGIPPSKILMIAFGRRSVDEIRHRLDMVSVDGIPCTTFHALALKIVREFHEACGLPANFNIATSDDADEYLLLARKELSPEQQKQLSRIADIKRLFSCKVNSCRTLVDAIAHFLPDRIAASKALRALYHAYTRLKLQSNVLDFDDLLRFGLKALQHNHVAATLRTRYARILVDEYQDTSRIQSHLLRKLRPTGKGVTLVGDPRQAIFSFRGADSNNMQRAEQLFSTKAITISLTTNHRSRRPTVVACNALMRNYGAEMKATQQRGKWPVIRRVPDGIQQAKQVAVAITHSFRSGIPLGEQAILVRTIIESELLQKELSRLRIPFVTHGGADEANSTAMAAFVRLVRWLVNPADLVSGLSTLSRIPGTNPIKARAILDAGVSDPGKLDQFFRLSVATRSSLKRLRRLRHRFSGSQRPSRKVLRYVGEWLGRMPMPDLTKIERALLNHTAQTSLHWHDFLDRLALVAQDNEGKPASDRVTISTIHAAKGREWKIVRVLNVVNGLVPRRPTSKANVEEERRLLFVAMSRAKSQLEMYVPGQVSFRGCYNSKTNLSALISPEVARCCRKLSYTTNCIGIAQN